MGNFGILSALIWFPMLGALILALLPSFGKTVSKAFAATISLVALAISLFLVKQFKVATFHFQFSERVDWIPQFGIRYEIGVDGISLWMLVLTAILSLVAILISDESVEKPKSYFALLLALESTLLGVFVAQDLILFYTFFELSLIPVALLILNWGGKDRKGASIKYLAALFAGSILMLVGMVALALLHQQATGQMSFSLIDIQAQVANGSLWRDSLRAQGWIFWAFALAFLVKSPGIPFHGWLASTYQASPIAAVVAGVVLKVGTYGMFRFLLPLFPDVIGNNVIWLMIIGVVGIIYGGIVAAGQTNGHRLLAFSTLSHVGFILIGLFSLTHTGLSGAAFQQINHGLTAAAMFVLLSFLYKRKEDQSLEAFGGLKRSMPLFATFFLIAMLANVGLPGTSGFVGEFLALLGAFEASYAGLNGLSIGYAVAAGFGVVLSAAYLLLMFQKLFYGKANPAETEKMKDLSLGEFGIALVFTVIMIGFGFFPSPIQKAMETSLLANGMMANNPVGQRPSWSDKSHEIVDPSSGGTPGALVLVPRTIDQIGVPVESGQIVFQPSIHPEPVKIAKTEASGDH